MLSAINSAAERWSAAAPWTNVVGVARTLLALGTALTLIASPGTALFTPAAGVPRFPHCGATAAVGLFCFVPIELLPLAQVAAVALLLLVASGWRPRFTAIPHWWIAFSVASSITIPDGGDQVTQNLTLLLLPVAITDPRRWHWSQLGPPCDRRLQTLVARSALLMIGLQMAVIYAHSSLGKLGVPEWTDGTALYYWSSDPMFGAPGWLAPILRLLTSSPAGVAMLTWGPLALEGALALALLLPPRARRLLLPAGIGFHVVIAVMMGLVSFALAMIAGLILYLRPADRPFSLAVLRAAVPMHRSSALRGRLLPAHK